jgi:hypothetical protein
MVYAHQPEESESKLNSLKVHTIRCQDRLLYRDAQKFCEYQHKLLNEFINEIVMEGTALTFINELRSFYPQFASYEQQLRSQQKANLLEFKMTPSALEEYQSTAFKNYIGLNEGEVLNFLLSRNVSAPQRVLKLALTLGKPEAIEVLLSHPDVLGGATVNSYNQMFGPSSKVSPLIDALKTARGAKPLIAAGADIYDKSKTIMPADIIKSKGLKIFPELIVESYAIWKKIKSLDGCYNPPKELINAFNEFRSICDEENDLSFLQGQEILPKNSRVCYAFQNFLKFIKDPKLKKEIELSELTQAQVAVSTEYKEKVNEINKQGLQAAEVKSQDLLSLLDGIIQKTNWPEITRFADKPKTILKIEELVHSKIHPFHRLEQIQAICQSSHLPDKEFFFSSGLSGRDPFTNEIYDILTDLIPSDPRSVTHTIDRLTELVSSPASKMVKS